MEDLSLKYVDRSNYTLIAINWLPHEGKKILIQFLSHPLKLNLKKLGFKFEIKGRPKSIYSIWTKMKKKGVNLKIFMTFLQFV